MKSDTATSDLVAVMLLIAVFVTAAAIAGVTLLSYPPGDAAPAMIARMESVGENVYIYHDGGDPLERGHFAILVDGVDQTKNFNLVDTSGNEHTTWTTWETGQALVPNADVTVSENSHIQIVGEGVSRTGSDWLLHDIGNGTVVGP
ncbi:MAG: type IV pilin N-terminal domain-containing protein, partial [Methanoculleus horonobensis]|nr:type IV pilin N-terminal domain-containing protein [Methanoculleus horonobensis]